MSIHKVAVLRVKFEALASRFEPATEGAVPAGFRGLVGKSGAVFGARALGDGRACVLATAPVSSPDELAVHLRAVLGDALDGHDEPRGIFTVLEDLVTGTAPAGASKSYDELVASGPGAWVPLIASNDERLVGASGWSFAAAASALGAPRRPQEETPAREGEDPLDALAGQVDQARREHRGLRDALEGALEPEGTDKLGAPDKKDA